MPSRKRGIGTARDARKVQLRNKKKRGLYPAELHCH